MIEDLMGWSDYEKEELQFGEISPVLKLYSHLTKMNKSFRGAVFAKMLDAASTLELWYANTWNANDAKPTTFRRLFSQDFDKLHLKANLSL